MVRNRVVDHYVPIKKIDEEEQIVWAEVYAPYMIDTQGEAMLPEDVQKLAHRYLGLRDLKKTIDTQHDEIPNGSYPLESFIARENDPDFTPGSHVLKVKVPSKDIWNQVKRGDLNGFSFQALVRPKAAVVEVDVDPLTISVTEENDGHSHLFVARTDDDGRVIGGRTSTDHGHSHEIRFGTATQETNGHSHRIFIA